MKSLKGIVDFIANFQLPPNQPRYNFIYIQHDAAILSYMLTGFTRVSSLSKGSIGTMLQVKVFSSSTEKGHFTFTVPMASIVGEAINMHIADHYLF